MKNQFDTDFDTVFKAAKRTQTLVVSMIVGGFALAVVIVSLIIWAAIHFIGKIW